MELKTTYQSHLEGVAEFVDKVQQSRIRKLASNFKQHKKLFSMFHHKLKIDESSQRLLIGAEGFPDKIEAILKSYGAPDKAFVLAAGVDARDSEINLRDALDKIVGMGDGAVISCAAGKLAFWESGDMNYRYILRAI